MPSGFLGSRADLIVDAVLIFNTIAPLWAWLASRLARKREYQKHMRLQAALCGMAFVALLTLEGNIRLSGGSGSLVAGSAYAGTPLLRAVFIAHIGPAVLTYLGWAWLTIASYRRRESALPGSFSRRHKLAARLVIAGLVWTALSALAVYYFGFVA